MSVRATGVPVTLIPGIPFGEANGRLLRLDLVLPPTASDAPRPAVVWVHGGGWFAGMHTDGLEDWCCPLLAAHGFVAATVEYRLSQEAPFPAQIHDVKGAIRWLRANAAAHQIDPDRIGIWGFSAGGHLAALAGLTGDLPALEGDIGPAGYSSRVGAVAAGSPATDFLRPGGEMRRDSEVIARLFGGTGPDKEDLMRLASPVAHVTGGAPPFLIAHGTADETAPFEQGRVLHEALFAAGVAAEFVPIEGAYHNWLTHPERFPGDDRIRDFGPLALAFFRKHLGPRGGGTG